MLDADVIASACIDERQRNRFERKKEMKRRKKIKSHD